MDTVRRRPRETLLAFDPLSAPSPSQPPPPPVPSSRSGLHALTEHPAEAAEGDEDEDDDQSFFSALGNDGFPAEGGGLVGELVQTSPERSASDGLAEQHQHADLLSWDSPVKQSLVDQPLAGPATPSAFTQALAVPLPDSPPASDNSEFDFLAPTPRPASKFFPSAAPSSSSALARAQKVPLPESPPRRHRDVMDWLADTPMPAGRRRGPDPDRSVRFDHGRDTTVVLAADEDASASFEDLRSTPAARTPHAVGTGTPPPAVSSLGRSPAAQQHASQASPERTTLLPSAPSWADDEDDDGENDLMRTPAPKGVRQFAFARAAATAEDLSTFPSLPSSSSSSPSSRPAPAAAPSTVSTLEPAEQTTFLPSVPDLQAADESYADLLSTPAPKRVQSLAADVSIWPPQPIVDDLGSSVSSTATVAPLSAAVDADEDGQAEKTTFLPAVPACLDESYDDLMSTPAPRRVKVFAAADVSVFPSPPSASPPSAPSTAQEEPHPAAEHDKTTFLPAVLADLDESYADLLTTPAPSRVRAFAPDVSAFPSPPSALDLGASTASSASASSSSTTETETATDAAAPLDDGDQTGFWPALGSVLPDDSFDDLMATPAPRRVKQLSISPPVTAAPAAPPAAATNVAPARSASPSLEERFGYLLASTRAAPPRTPIAPPSRASSSANAAAVRPSAPDITAADETFDLDALAGAGGLVGDETFDLLSKPLPSLAQSRTANFPRASASPPSSSAASPSAGRGSDASEPADETLVLDSKAFDVQDDGLSFSLLTGGGPAAVDDDEGDGWGLEEERALERLMGSDRPIPSSFRNVASAPAPAAADTASKKTALPPPPPPPPRSTTLPPAATPLRAGSRQAVPARASATGSTLRRTSSSVSHPTPRTSSDVRAPVPATPAAAATPSHRRTSSVASAAVGREASAGERALGKTPSTLRRTSSVAATFARDAATPSLAERTPAQSASSGVLRWTSQIVPAATAGRPSAATVTPSHARMPSLSTRQPRTSIAPLPAAPSATPARSLHRRTSSASAITGSTPLPRAFARGPAVGGRTPLVGSNPSVNALLPAGPVDDPTATRLKDMSVRIQTLNKKDGTRSLNSSLSRPAVDGGALALSGGSNASLSTLSERVSSSRLQSRSVYALPCASTGSAATSASRLPRDPSLASGIRAPSSSSAATKAASGAAGAKAAPTLESVRAALASLEARRRK